MSFISNIRDTFVNVRKRDYEETVEMHSALESLVKRALNEAVPLDGFVDQFFPELPAYFHGHFSFLAEKIIASSGLYSIQSLPKYEDTEALYQHRDYLRGMTQVMKSSKEYEDHIFRAAHGIIFELVNALPDSVTTPASDEIEVSFEVPASQFFHHNGHELIDIVLNHLFREELVDTPLFISWRVIILNNFKALYENHHIRGNEYSARSLKGKLPINEFTQAIFYPLPLSNLFNFSVPFALPAEDRFKHQYVLGKTGSGKSVLLRHQIAHDLNAGHGVVVMTPERDLINDVLSYVPDSRADDVVHFDASDDTSPLVGFNPFALHDKSLLTQRAGELELILIRTLGDMGVKMKPILSNSIYALLATQGSLHDIPKLLDPNNTSYRRSIAAKLDERTREFFEKYDTSTYYKEVYEPIINRLDPLLRPPLSTTLTTPALDFNHLLNDTSSIVLCNLSRLRGFQAEIVGQLLLAIFQQTFFARDSLPESKRLPYFFYMDEFQTYATGSEHSLKDFLTRARKYKVGIVMAHQNTDDIPGNLLSSIFGNCGTLCGMLMSSKDASTFTREAQLANFRGFDRAEAQLQNFLAGEIAIATPQMKQARICRTPERPPFPFSVDRIDRLKAYSKSRFGVSTKATKSPEQKPPNDKPPPTSPPDTWEDLGYRLS